MKRDFWLVFLCFCIFGNAAAQSGRTVPPSQTEPESSIPDKPKEVANCEPNLTEYIYISPRKINKFTEELNRFGKCGYRLEKSNKTLIDKLEVLGEPESKTDFFGVMKLDLPHRYEYQWFEAYSPGQAQTRMNFRAKEGFYFKASYPFQQIAENRDGDFSDIATNKFRSIYGTILIFEKRDDEKSEREYRVLDSDGIGKVVKERNQDKLNEALRQNFYPVGFIKEREYFGIVMEKDDRKKAEAEYRILNYNFNLTKKLGELSKTNFQPEFIALYVALIKKESNQPIEPRTYKIFEDFENLFENPTLLDGRYYLMSGSYYINGGDLKPNLLFANAGNAKAKYEYKLHKMTAVLGRAKAENRFDMLIKPPTAEMSAEFQNLLKQGYLIREVLALKEIYILFERPVNMIL